MSDYRNQNDRNRYGHDDDRYGQSNERDARRRAYQGERDAYGEWDREGYGRSGTETGYGRERSSNERYGPSLSRGAGQSQSAYGRGYDERYDRPDTYRPDAYRDGRGYGDDRFGRRSGAGGERTSYAESDARYRQASGTGREDVYGNDGYRGEDRGFIERAGDEIASWFGDRDAERRREADRQFGGKGPKGYTRSDERIRDDINDRLTDDHYIDASDIEVAVSNREVTLSGHVPSRDQKRRAEDLAERVSGVSHVQNNLRVSTGTGAYGGTGSTTTTGSAGVGSTAGEVGGQRSWSTDTTVKTVS